MFSIAPLLLFIVSSATAFPRPQGYIPTSRPLNTSTTNAANNPGMFLQVFDSASGLGNSQNPCSNQTATLYPSIPELRAPTGSCVNANTINTGSVTCVSRFDVGRMDFTIWNCPLVSYAAQGCSGVSQDIAFTAQSNSWILPAGGAKSFQFACTLTDKMYQDERQQEQQLQQQQSSDTRR